MLKISWVTENFIDVDLPVINELSGAFEIFWHISHRMTSEFYTVSDITALKTSDNVKRTIYIAEARFANPKSIFHYLKIINNIRKEKADIIYLNLMGMPYFFPLADMFLPKNKVIYAAHDVINHINEKRAGFMTFYREHILRRYNNFHIFSETQKEIFEKRFPTKKYFVARLYTKDYGASKMVRNEEFTNLPIRLLFFGRIRYDKGLALLCEAANKLAKLYPGALKITIAGYCENWELYEEATRDGELFTTIIRNINNSEIPNLFEGNHFTILPYREVTQSGVLMVAYNYGVPVIATNFEEFRNYVSDGVTGYIAEPSTEGIYDVLEKLIVKKNDNYKEIKANLKEFVDKNISLKSIAQAYGAFFVDMNFRDKR